MFWFSCQYLPSDRLRKTPLMKPLASLGVYLNKNETEECVWEPIMVKAIWFSVVLD